MAEINTEANRAKGRRFYQKHKTQVLAEHKAYREAHRDKVKTGHKAYYEAHRDEIHAKQKAHRELHKEELNAKRRAYRESHREKELARGKAYYHAHKEEINARRIASRKARRQEHLIDTNMNYKTKSASKSKPFACVVAWFKSKFGSKRHYIHSAAFLAKQKKRMEERSAAREKKLAAREAHKVDKKTYQNTYYETHTKPRRAANKLKDLTEDKGKNAVNNNLNGADIKPEDGSGQRIVSPG